MPKIFALTTISALALVLIAAAFKPHEGARETLVPIPIPIARAAPSPFPEAPTVAASAPSFPEAASAKSASAETESDSLKTAASKMAAAPAPAKKAPSQAKAAPAKKSSLRAPIGVSIPSIALNSKVVPVGVNSKGEMDVPSGSTSNIGWYAKGTVPGDTGSAVMDAHVFATLSRLDEVSAGDDIYVSMADGATRRFTVTRAQVYKVGDLSPSELFSQNDGRYLHLITCAGELTPDHQSYTHRLVVYATLAK